MKSGGKKMVEEVEGRNVWFLWNIGDGKTNFFVYIFFYGKEEKEEWKDMVNGGLDTQCMRRMGLRRDSVWKESL